MTPIEYKNEVSVIEEGYRGETLHAREEERDGALVLRSSSRDRKRVSLSSQSKRRLACFNCDSI